ncbi:MAG: type I restriction enzyme HsdR N-terminal domain-containing protein [bacterium]
MSDFSVSLWEATMDALNLPVFDVRTRSRGDQKQEIWDLVRRKFIALTPEEWVRQHFLNFLIHHRGYPASLIRVEASLVYNRLKKRSDIVTYDKRGKPLLLVECKAPQVAITQEVFNQVALYNSTFTGKYLVVSNGLEHYCSCIDHAKKTWKFLRDIPHYSDICDSKDDHS